MLELSTGCRLHFGLMELAAGQPHRFAGLGLMVQAPRVRVQVGPRQFVDASRSTDQEIDARVRATVEHAQHALGLRLPADWSVAAVEHPRLHSGLGLGTQLAAAVAAAAQLACIASLSKPDDNQQTSTPWRSFAATAQRLDASLAKPSPANATPSSLSCQADQVRALARLSGRGKRSAVGLHGFLFGGLVQDFGQSDSEPQGASGAEQRQASSSPVARERTFGTRSCAFPSGWPIILILSTEGGDMCGAAEERLISQAGAAPNAERTTMLGLSDSCMTAASADDFDCFASSLERYMDIAATLFASVQAGRYRDERIAARVERAQRAGLRAVGQSSWGPTVFGFAETDEQAQQAAKELRTQLTHEPVEVIVTRAANQGASWRQMATGVQHAS